LAGLLPEDSDISFEYHLFGALTGAAAAFALRARDPQLPAENTTGSTMNATNSTTPSSATNGA